MDGSSTNSTHTCSTQTAFTEHSEKPDKVELQAQMEPYHIFGLLQKARNNLLFSDDHTVIFPSGNYCVQYNVCQQWTKFLPGAMPEKQGSKGIQALAISPDRKYLAVSECREQGIITIYDLHCKQCCKRQVLTGGSTNFQEFTCMAFSADSRYLLGQSGAPEWTLFYWDWEKDEVVARVTTTRHGFVSQVSFNPKDSAHICVSGKYVFKIFKLENNTLKQTRLPDMDLESVVSHAWMPEDCIVLGTEGGKLLMVKAGCLRNLARKSVKDANATASPTDTLPGITAITQYSKGFACAAGPGICLYEKCKEYGYTNTTEIMIPQDPCSIKSEQLSIVTMCTNPSEETLAISTHQGQIYSVNLKKIELSKDDEVTFKFLIHSVHSRSITGLSTCTSKSLFATCSKDNSVRIWSYKNNSLELYKEFPEEPNCISLHPNGLSMLVGFPDKVCLMHLMIDGFRTVKEFDIHNCNQCVFNHDGNVFAAVSDHLINICNIRTGEKVELNGHTNKVLQVKWSDDDHCLESCRMDGTVYEWNSLTQTHTSKKQQDLCNYSIAKFLPKTGSIIAVDSDFTLKELRDGEILWEKASDDVAYTALSVTHLAQAVFIGTALGTVRVMQYPLDEEKPWTEYLAHSGAITEMAVTPDDQYLLTASEDGSLLIWTIKLTMGKEIDCTEEFLCTKGYLQKKDQHILNIQAQLELLKEEHECKINQIQTDYKQKKKDFVHEIKDLKDLVEVLKTEKEEQRLIAEELKASFSKSLTEMLKKQSEELEKRQYEVKVQLNDQDVKSKVSERSFEERLKAIQQSYEMKLREQEDTRFHTTMDMKRAYEDQLRGQQEMLQQSEKKVKELQEKIDSGFKDVILQYKQKIQAVRESNMELENEMKLMEKQMIKLWKIKGEIRNQYIDFSEFEVKVEELKQWLEKCENQLLIKNKVRNLKTILYKMKTDINHCSSFIRQPKMLLKNFAELHKTYIHAGNEIFETKAKVEHTKQKKHLQRTGVSHTKSPIMDAKNRSTEIFSILKEQAKEEVKESCTELCKVCLGYKQKLQVEKETCRNLRNEMKLMEEQMSLFWKIKGQIQDQNHEISMLKEEVQSLYDGHKKVKDLAKEKQEKTIYDQEMDFQGVVKIQEKSSRLIKEDLININSRLNEMVKERKTPTKQTAEIDLQEILDKIKKKKQLLKRLKVEVEESHIMTIEPRYILVEKLKLKEKELGTEKQTVRKLKDLVERMKDDIKNCSSLIQYPIRLKENILKLHSTYVQRTDVQVVPEPIRKKLQKPAPLISTTTMEAKNQQHDYTRIMKQHAMKGGKIYQTCKPITITKGTVPNARTFSEDSQMRSGRGHLTLPLLHIRNLREMMNTRDMGQHRGAHRGSVERLKFPPINGTQ